jgi:hypothetical protein
MVAMRSETRHLALKTLIIATAILALLLLGSFAYWHGEGQPGTPNDFRDRVADAGLDVAWSNSGPRGGTGVVDTTCGPVEVTIDELDGQLWIRLTGEHEVLTTDVVDALLSCSR